MNYDGGRMRPSAADFTPFTDANAGQNVSFVNLPLEGGVHRNLTSATSIPPQAVGPQSALVGSSYQLEQGNAISPDTPAKSPPDDTSYTAPTGGVLASIYSQVLPGQFGQPSLSIDLDDGTPNAPGTNLVLFNGSGTDTAELAEGGLSDGFH